MAEDSIVGPIPEDAKAAFEQTKGTGVELEQAEDSKSTDTDKQLRDTGVPGLTVIRGLITATFFADLFTHQAHQRYPHSSAEARVAAHVRRHPMFYKICRYSDYFYRVAASFVLLAALGMIAYGAIWKIFYA